MDRAAFEIFSAVVDLPPSEREAALLARCGDDAELLETLRELLEIDASGEADQIDEMVTSVVSTARQKVLAVEPGQKVGNYRVGRLLGTGGTAEVYFAAHRTLGTRHALKVLHHTSPELRERLLEEGRLQASLSHPGIVRVTDAVPVTGGTGLIMDCLLYTSPSPRDDR